MRATGMRRSAAVEANCSSHQPRWIARAQRTALAAAPPANSTGKPVARRVADLAPAVLGRRIGRSNCCDAPRTVTSASASLRCAGALWPTMSVNMMAASLRSGACHRHGEPRLLQRANPKRGSSARIEIGVELHRHPPRRCSSASFNARASSVSPSPTRMAAIYAGAVNSSALVPQLVQQSRGRGSVARVGVDPAEDRRDFRALRHLLRRHQLRDRLETCALGRTRAPATRVQTRSQDRW